MKNEIKNIFKDKEYCLKIIGEVRQTWGMKSTFTQKAIDGAEKTLGFMFLYCPEDIQSIVLSTLNELEIRRYKIYGME